MPAQVILNDSIDTYSIDDFDTYAKWGIVFRSGSNDLLKMPQAKARYSYDWQDQNGVQIDLSSPTRFHPKTISMEMTILADSREEFWLNYTAFFNYITSPNTKALFSKELSRTFLVLYQDCTEFTRFTRMNTGPGSWKIGCDFTIQFLEPVPSLFKSLSFLLDKDANFIVTTVDNLKIII